MARFWVLSDLHIDASPFEAPAETPACDGVIIAGDTCSRLSERVLPWIAETFGGRGHPVIYVPGNHCYWNTNAAYENEKAATVADNLGITLLAAGETAIVAGARIVGATLWTDYKIAGDAQSSMRHSLDRMNDHRRIRFGAEYRKWLPTHASAIHAQHLQAIRTALAPPFDGPSIVVTHHAPAPQSLRQGKVTEFLDGAYASDLKEFIESTSPDLWIHGHVHVSRDYWIGKTRILANPRGYVVARTGLRGKSLPAEVENPAFEPALISEV
ncbi:metallophosphoesterase [Zavarzinia compransoris]|uniref:Metallophosphoesterase n=1 Tax=Zavarzinia compransoris TaxID=1264899 RepID=A0A317DVE6_9PROT|nr:metallophosphoesterase [Zavarzinia compransoris]PWR18354.1 metallophosphoesterase [Zavarzinia compransoris]TDP43583.1 Icc-related predicted phosphoesterase [Zavarzinia compransoris]